MGLSDGHKMWRGFKQNNPAFERPKEVKVDFGGELDKLTKLNAGWYKAEEQSQKYFDGVTQSVARVRKALEAFDKSVTATSRKTNNARVLSEFTKVKTSLDDYLNQWEKVLAARKTYTDALNKLT